MVTNGCVTKKNLQDLEKSHLNELYWITNDEIIIVDTEGKMTGLDALYLL